MITMILQPTIPSSMHSFVTKYNLPTRLWSNAFHHCLKTLARASTRNPNAVEHMTGFIYWGYHFYETYFEMSNRSHSLMAPYKGYWIEALGDLASYRMSIAARDSEGNNNLGPSAPLTVDALPPSTPYYDDTPPPSIGLAAAHALNLEPEREVWRRSSQQWYSLALKDSPGVGRLHHHLGLLSKDASDEELRGVYHFVKRYASILYCTRSQ